MTAPFDLSLLTPAPWACIQANWTPEHGPRLKVGHRGDKDADIEMTEADVAFIALARNALDIMLKRLWTPFLRPDGRWEVIDAETGLAPESVMPSAGDPFSALVEADKWLKEREG